MSRRGACLLVLLLAAACSDADVASDDLVDDVAARDLRSLDRTGLVVGELGPGRPPAGDVPAEVALVFEKAGRRVEVTAVDGRYRVELPPGVWSVRSADALTCATGLDAFVGAVTRYDLPYPLQGCADLSSPPGG